MSGGFVGKKPSNSASAAPVATLAPPPAASGLPQLGSLMGSSAPAPAVSGLLGGGAAIDPGKIGQVLQGTTDAEVVAQIEHRLAATAGPSNVDSAVAGAAVKVAVEAAQKALEARINALEAAQHRVEAEVKEGLVKIHLGMEKGVSVIHDEMRQGIETLGRAIAQLANLGGGGAPAGLPSLVPAAPPPPIKQAWIHPGAGKEHIDAIIASAQNVNAQIPNLPAEYRSLPALATGLQSEAATKGIIDVAGFLVYFSLADPITGAVAPTSPTILESRSAALRIAHP
jgi:hypothetical protein